MAKQPNMDAERAAFESVMPEAYPRCRNMPDKSYNSPQLYERWIGWQACVEYHSLRAAPMGEELPALLDQVADDIEPVAAFTPNGRAVKWHPSYQASEGYTTLYTAEQVRQAQRDAIAADRAARAQLQAQSIGALVREVSAQLTADVMEHVGLPAEDGDDHGEQNYLTGKFAGITMFERALLKLVDGRTAGAAPADPFAGQRFLNWNRSQNKPPVAIGKELGVARKVLEFAAAPSPQQGKEGGDD